MKQPAPDSQSQNPLRRIAKKGLQFCLQMLPVKKNRILFDNFGGRGFGDDPKYIALALLEKYPELELCWLTSDPHTPLPKEIRKVKYGGISTAYLYATSSIWISNYKGYPKPAKKKKQQYIQTWHSTIGFKKNEADALSLAPAYIEQSMYDASLTDLMYSDNDFRLRLYQTKYWYHGPVIKCDVPRISVLYNPPPALSQAVRQAFGIGNERIALYAPTFRDTLRYEEYRPDIERCIRALEERFGEPFVMLIRLHPNEIRLGGRPDTSADNVRDACNYPDMQELLAVTDVLITDYSGSMFDCSFTDKPVFLFMKDHDDYLSRERGTYFTVDQMPFPQAENDDALAAQILSFDETAYRKGCAELRERIGYSDSGHGGQVIADIVWRLVNGESITEASKPYIS